MISLKNLLVGCLESVKSQMNSINKKFFNNLIFGKSNKL